METAKITAALEGAKAAGIDNIVALRGGAQRRRAPAALPAGRMRTRGRQRLTPPTPPPPAPADPPAGQAEWTATDGGFSCALDLVKHIRAAHGDHFCLSVAGYPEGHPTVIKKIEPGRELSASEARRVVTLDDGEYVCSDADYAGELAYLKSKIDAGGDMILTQMFFDVDVFTQFVADCRAAGITVPIVPGIMVIQAYGGFKRMTAFCRSRVPAWIVDALAAVKDDEAAVKAEGIRIGTQMCRALLAAGVRGLHFYTLNLERVTFAIMKELGLLHGELEAE